jgi:replicative DNA helicase
MRSQAEWEMPRPAQAHLKTMPHATEAEQSVLGGLLLDNQAWFQIADLIVEGDFYHRNHTLIFRAIAALSAQNIPFDVITVSDWLEKQNLLSTAGGFEYLVNVARNTPSAANIATYAEIVRECSVLRQLNRVGTEITESTFDAQNRSPSELLEDAEKKIFAIAEQTNRKGGFLPIRQILTKAIDKIDELFQKNTSITGVSSGFSDLDDKTAGLQPSDLIIIAGRPSMGKTSFVMNIAENVAVGSHLPVAVFSLEMPGEQLAMRLIASLGRIDQQKVRTGRLDDDDWPRLTMAINMLAETKLFIDDTPGLSPSEIRARARRLVREEGQLGLIVIDYLQLMQLSGGKENRATEISEISRALKALAKELQVPVIALSQLNRSVEHRQDKRPQLADLRESGAIEQDADLVMFIYRDEVYNEESPDKGTAEIIIAKQRNGPIGMVRLAFRGQFTRFENFAAEQYYSEE